LLRDGLTRLLVASGFDVVAVADGPSLRDALIEHRPDLAIVDIRLPPSFTDEGLRTALRAREERPGLPVLVLSQYVEPLYARELLEDSAGGIGYLLKDRVADIEAFLATVRAVAAGGTVMDPQVVEQMLAVQTPGGPVSLLTRRETDVLELMAQGRSNAAIAETVFITEKSVSKVSNSIFIKLGLELSEDDNRRVLAVLAYLQPPVRPSRAVSARRKPTGGPRR